MLIPNSSPDAIAIMALSLRGLGMIGLSDRKKRVLERFDLQELALLVAEALALESKRQDGNFTLDRLSQEFGTLAFKYGDILRTLPTQDSLVSDRSPNKSSVKA